MAALGSQVREGFVKCGQQHVLDAWEATAEEAAKASFRSQLQAVSRDLSRFENILKTCLPQAAKEASAATAQAAAAQGPAREPPEDACISRLADRRPDLVQRWRALGYEAMRRGQYAVLLLAGGQGTRLGSADPKGCYDVGLPSRKSLFQLQAERLLRTQQLSRVGVEADASSGAPCPPIPWYIMTSDATHEATRDFFQRHAYFGLEPSQVLFFQQGMLPSVTPEGKMILETPSKIAMNPDGNGGLYPALQREGMLADMAARGVRHVNCYCVDNVLAKVADPVFVGYCIEKGATCGAKVLAKRGPHEKVGAFVQPVAAAPARDAGEAGAAGARAEGADGGQVSASAAASQACQGLEVIEYSELGQEMAEALDPVTGQLRFQWANICMHYFHTDFLRDVLQWPSSRRFHIAQKKIPSAAGLVDAIKFEQFIFDPFPNCRNFALFEVCRPCQMPWDTFQPLLITHILEPSEGTVLAPQVMSHYTWQLVGMGSPFLFRNMVLVTPYS
eukprot:jgi/Mesvir1/7442/Mv19221-RA.2